MESLVVLGALALIAIAITGLGWAVGTQERHLMARALRSETAANEICDASDDVTATSALTDNTGGAVVTALAAGVGKYDLIVPLTSLATGLGAGALDVVTAFIVNHKFKVTNIDFVTTIVGAGAGASQVFNLEIGTTDLTGGVVTVTLASTDTVGKVTAGTAITAANTGASGANMSLEKAAGGTVFTSGAGFFRITVQNMDTADALATLIQG